MIALALCAASRVAAQSRNASLVGWIRDSTGAPVMGADVEIAALHALAQTDSTGAFALHRLAPGKVTVLIRHIGDDPQQFDFVLHGGLPDSVSVTMSRNAQLLDAMRTDGDMRRRVAALDGFYRRRARGNGVFITREELDARHTNLLSDALREIPGLQFARRGGRQDVRVPESIGRVVDCPPQYWVDGERVYNIQTDAFPASDIEGIEIYAGPANTPARFAQSAGHYTCGTIVLWTRVPGGH